MVSRVVFLSMVALVTATGRGYSDCLPNDRVTVTLSKNPGSQPVGQGCWMDQAKPEAKQLCAHDIKREHKLQIDLTNKCDVPVTLKVTVSRGDVKFFPRNPAPDANACRDGSNPWLFNEPVMPGQTKSASCTTRRHGRFLGVFKWTRRGSYEVTATHAADVQLPRPVTFDPEIVIEDNGRNFFAHVLKILLLLLLGAAGLWGYRRFTRSRHRA